MFKKIIHTLFRKESGLQRYFVNTSWLLGARAVQMLVSLVVGAMLARYLGTERFGIYNYAISYVGIFLAISSLGLSAILIRDVLNKTSPENILYGSAFTLRLAGSIIASAIVIVLSHFTEDDPAIRLFLLLASLQPIVRSTEIIIYHFQAKVQSRYTVISQLSSLAVISIIKVYFILSGYPLIYFFYLLLLDSTIVGMMLIAMYRKQEGRIFAWRYDHKVAMDMLKASWPLIFSGMLSTIYLKIDQVMIQKMMGSSDVGLYAAAVKISESWLTIPWIISGSLYPALVNAYGENKSLFRDRVSQGYILLMAVSLSVIVPVCLLSGPVIHFIYGDAYAASAGALRIHIFSSLFIFIGTMSYRWLVVENLQKYWMINTAVGAVTNVILNLILIPDMGINGAALATLLSYGFANHFAYLIPRDTRKIFYEQNRMFLKVITVIPALRMIRRLRYR